MRSGGSMLLYSSARTGFRRGLCFAMGVLRTSLSPDRYALVELVAWFSACLILVWPNADVPIIDEWTYAWSVEHVLQTGTLELLPISSVYPVMQILWGALFSAPAGFSFAALRVSTVALAIVGASALYLTLRELGLSSQRARLGTFFVIANPVSILLTHSFMTDIPYLSIASCAALMYVRGFTQGRRACLWLAALLSVGGILIRQVALAVPVAAFAVWLTTKDPKLRKAAALPVLCACLASFALWILVSQLLGRNEEEARRLELVRYALKPGPVVYAQWVLEVLLMLAFMLLPLTLSTLRGRGWRGLASAVGVAVLSYAWMRSTTASTSAFNPLVSPVATLTTHELGGARNLLHGMLESTAYDSALAGVAEMLAFFSLGLALCTIVRAIRRNEVTTPSPLGFRFFVALGLCHLVLICVLWLFSDRYYLVLLPTAVVCLLSMLGTTRVSMRVAIAALLGQAVLGIVGTRDVLHYNQMCERARTELRRAGIHPYDIDAGWTFNGWVLYAQPENLPAGVDRARDIPGVTSKARRPFMLAVSPVEGYELVQRWHWTGLPWPRPHELFILRKVP